MEKEGMNSLRIFFSIFGEILGFFGKVEGL